MIPLRTVLLTTDTTHHLHFAWRLRQEGLLDGIVIETRKASTPFDTAHPFEALRDEHERATLLPRPAPAYADLAPTRWVESANGADGLAALRELAPDVTIVFGTGRLATPTIAAAGTCLNLHGGHPEHYRGLDTHLWAIYHEDWPQLVTTLHHVDATLDTGDIVLQSAVPLARGMRIHELRAANTRVCVDLSLHALRALRDGHALPRRPQLQKGRYYSAMPAVLKEVCARKLQRHTEALP